MTTEDNKTVVQRFWQEVFNEKNLDVADELFASDHELHVLDLPAEERGPYTVKGFAAIFHNVSPSIQLDIQDEIAAEDKVVNRWTARGPLADELKSAGATDDEVTVSGISIFRVSDGEIKETWHQLEGPRNESEASRLPDNVRDQWLSTNPEFQRLYEIDPGAAEGIGCRLCRCC
jgi:predicted SnoaL-like aldol condensation-catalyzing enzyme